MPTFGMFPQSVTLFGPATLTASSTSGVVALPPAESYRIIFQVSTVSGTSPTLVGVLMTSFDAGSTYNQIMTTTSITTTGLGQQFCFRPFLGSSELASTFGTSLDTTNLAAATGAYNGPIDCRYIKVKLVVAGTSPSFTNVTVGAICMPPDYSGE